MDEINKIISELLDNSFVEDLSQYRGPLANQITFAIYFHKSGYRTIRGRGENFEIALKDAYTQFTAKLAGNNTQQGEENGNREEA